MELDSLSEDIFGVSEIVWAMSRPQHIHCVCFVAYVCEVACLFLSVYICVHRMHGLSDTAKEVCGKFSRCTELGEVLTRPQLCQICPNQTRGPEKTQAAHQGLPNQGNKERKREGRCRFHHYFWSHVRSRPTARISVCKEGCDYFRENHEVLICWMMGWVVVSHVLLIWKEHLLACQNAGSLMLFMDVHKSSSYSSSARLWYSTCVQQRLTSRFVRHKAVCIRGLRTVYICITSQHVTIIAVWKCLNHMGCVYGCKLRYESP